MATVFLAHDIRHDRPVALKVLHPQLSAALGGDRFLREIRIAAHLQHPHILTLIDSGAVADGNGAPFLYYVMPYVEGDSLRQRLAREQRLSSSDTIRIVRDVLDALAQAHAQGIIHRDIKPENIMLSGRHALVVDFGIARAATAAAGTDAVAGQTLTTIGLAVGTPAYMSPEQAAGQASVDARSDLYAVGVMAYEMLTGQPPFSGSTPQAILAAQVTKTPPSLSVVAPTVGGQLAAAIMRCLEKDPDQRWQSADDMLEQLEAFTTPRTESVAAVPVRRVSLPRWAALAAIGAAVVLASGYWLGPGRKARATRWSHEVAIPQLLALSERGQWDSAYALAREVEAINPDDSMFQALRPAFARRMSFRTDPPGATVWRKAYAAPESTWTELGRTPLDSALLALTGSGSNFLNANRIRITAPGYRTLELIGMPFTDSVIRLDRDDAIPAEMVRVSGGDIGVDYPGFDPFKTVPLAEYLMDRLEVSNREYKVFVDSGGYRRRDLWEYPFVKDGRTLSWEAAMALMTDGSGRPGPSTWEAGDYPAGQGQHPVAGVSWYEAAAYARFMGKALPTVLHWNHAATVRNSAVIIPASNFGSQGTRPGGVGDDVSGFGTFDMAGNVREWCANASGTDRFILGGAWNDALYSFNDAYAQPPFNRSPANGIRLVRYQPDDPGLAQAAAPLQRLGRNFLKERPVSDEVFRAYLQMYQYDKTPLHARVLESEDQGAWIRELVRMDAAYAGDTLLAYLYLPKLGQKPWPLVVYFPSGGPIHQAEPQTMYRSLDFVVKSGRAVIFPVYKGTFQRRDSLAVDTQDSTNFWRDHVVMWAKDMSRSIDYAETRADLDAKNVAYYGLSWGGAMGGLMPAVEPRIKASVLVVAGLEFPVTRPEVEPLNFLPRVTVPTLMINGRYDFFFPVESSQEPMFRLLGTPASEKRHVVAEGSHDVPRALLIQEVLGWLDKYQPLPSVSR
jgi:serine/threonine protein kinase/formylglycine-generating enzyme required for sulfatase activity/pimeloyl-ACP methyl ester carboxylesterase